MGESLENAAAAAMYAQDRNAATMGMNVTSAEPGTASVEMTVQDTMVNGLDVCHGGIVFTLADTAMAFASNAHGGTHLATTAEIEWVAPSRRGDRLVATATERHRRGRGATYDVTVHGPDGLVALFRGRTRQIADRTTSDEATGS